jgi:hexosaminidase
MTGADRPTSSSPALFPRPRSLRLDPTRRSTAELRAAVDPSLPAQGYELTVDDDGARLRHADDAGLRYGRQTVDQLRDEQGSLPHGRVADHPDVPVRGFMLDVSRDRVPTRTTLARLVALLERCRYNHLQLYVEHTYAYEDHADVWRDASPLTPDDIRWLDERCRAAGIELAANQNCFGHMGRWLALPRYRDRAECPDGTELIPGLRWPPGVLAPTEANARFVLDLVREQTRAFTSRAVNVGCDETFELGRGASAAQAATEGVGVVYLEHLRRIVDPLLAEGRAVQFWGDVVGHHPELADRLPAGDLTPLVWSYEAPHRPPVELDPVITQVMDALGIDIGGPTDFATLLVPFLEAGLDSWVVPGTSTWNSLVGRLDNARANLLDAATAARDHGLRGMLVTDWGDNGHHQPPSVSDPAIAYGGAVAWCAETNADLDLAPVLDALHRDDAALLGSVLVTIGGVAARTGATAFNGSPIVPPLIADVPDLSDGRADVDALRAVVSDLQRARGDLDRARPRADDGDVVRAELDVAIGLARQGSLRLLERLGEPAVPRHEADAELAALIEDYRATWSARSRPGGLADSAGRLERAIERR